MITYGDYFSRRTLHSCGISPDKMMIKKDEMAHTGMQRMDKIRTCMSDIYKTLCTGYAEKNAAEKDFSSLNVEGKIVSAFYDSGLINSAEKDVLAAQTMHVAGDREQICVEEATVVADAVKAPKVDTQVKMPTIRNIQQ